MLSLGPLLICVAALLMADTAHAQQYPSRPVQIIVANGPGSASDVVARMVIGKMASSLGQPSVFVNRPGAGGIIAARDIANAPRDGYTLLTATDGTYTAVPLSHKNAGYALKSVTTIGEMAVIPSVLLVSSTLHVKTLGEFVTLAKAKPGQLNYSMFEQGAVPQLWLDWFLKRLGLLLRHIPYKSGSELVTAAANGDAAITISSLASSQAFIDAGKLIPIVLTDASLKSRFPDVPLVSDIIRDPINGNSSIMLFGPPDLPADILNLLNHELLKAEASPDVRDFLTKIGLVRPTRASPEEEKGIMERKLKEHMALIQADH